MVDNFSCPLPLLDFDTIQIAHGAGGKLSADLIEKIFLPCFANPALNQLEDQAVINAPNGRLAFSTDSYVVQPIFFPGGNIGELAVNGTINDLCMSGAIPKYLSVGFILEEGLAIAELHKIVLAMKKAADQAGVLIVTGDTKVVNKGACDKLFINTSGIGFISEGVQINARQIRPGDKIIVSGTIADHGMAVLTSREKLSFQTPLRSDTAALNFMVSEMLQCGSAVHAMRDPTRGGLAATLNELARASDLGFLIHEDKIKVRDDVRGACELLGIDPLYVANEGKLIAFVAESEAEKVLSIMQNNALGKEAVIIGEALPGRRKMALLKNRLGVERIIDMPIGEQLPRIC
jgi:hydrogenase expression/formation protein HypE